MKKFREFVATNDISRLRSRTDMPDNDNKYQDDERDGNERDGNTNNERDGDALQHLMRAVKKAAQIDPIKLAGLIEREFRNQEIESDLIQFKNTRGTLKRPSEDGLGNLGSDNLDSIKISGEHPDASGDTFDDD